MRNLLHEINGVMSAFVSEKFIAGVSAAQHFRRPNLKAGDVASASETAADEELTDALLTDADHSDDAFSVERGNVAFACAADEWGRFE